MLLARESSLGYYANYTNTGVFLEKIQNVYIGDISLGQLVGSKLDIGESFLIDLQNEDDWGFVVKLAALLEAVVTELLIQNIDNEKINIHITKLNLLGATGKLKLGKELDALNPRLVKLCNAFQPLRNKFVHSTKYLHTPFNEFLSDYTDIADKLKSTLPAVERNSTSSQGKNINLNEIFEEDSRQAIYLSALMVLAESLTGL